MEATVSEPALEEVNDPENETAEVDAKVVDVADESDVVGECVVVLGDDMVLVNTGAVDEDVVTLTKEIVVVEDVFFVDVRNVVVEEMEVVDIGDVVEKTSNLEESDMAVIDVGVLEADDKEKVDVSGVVVVVSIVEVSDKVCEPVEYKGRMDVGVVGVKGLNIADVSVLDDTELTKL